MSTEVISNQPIKFRQRKSIKNSFFPCWNTEADYDDVVSNGVFNKAFHDDNVQLHPPSAASTGDKEHGRWLKPNDKNFPLKLYCEDGKEYIDALHSKSKQIEPVTCQSNACTGSVMRPILRKNTKQFRDKSVVIKEMKEFLDLYYTNLNKHGSHEHKNNVDKFTKSIQTSGLYDITADMLSFGAKTAWRNASRCVGRIQWSNLKLFDRREVTTPKQMFGAICDHITYANNKGNLRSAITIFPARTDGKHDFRIWNPQLISYAGYQQPDGSIIGDPANAEFTLVCERLGWKGNGGRFDILPMVVQANGGNPEVFKIPQELIMEVNLTHPRYPWFEELGLKWFCLPAVSHMSFEVGGLEFPASPFNGWYMESEIGARDLCDNQRYNIIPEVAQYMDLDTTSRTSLWKDITMIEINVAVLHSFRLAGVTIMDHHTATETFVTHIQQEQISRGGCPADWVWIVPPISGSLTPVFHMEMLNYRLKPSYEYQQVAWIGYKWENFKRKTMRQLAYALLFSVFLMSKITKKRIRCTILYATETGKSLQFAHSLATIYRNTFTTEIICADEYNISKLPNETLLLVVTSTFGEGDAPTNAQGLKKTIWDLSRKANEQKGKNKKSSGKINSTYLKNVRFSVFALGSRAYPKFCQFGQDLDQHLTKLGAVQIHEVGKGDELCSQENSFKEWAFSSFKVACDNFSIQIADNIMATLTASDVKWQPSSYRVRPVANTSLNITQALSETHNQNVVNCRLISRQNLQSNDSDRETILVKLEIPPNHEMKYSPGDHVGIFASNSAEEVEIIMNHVLDRPQDFVDLKVQRQDSGFWKDQKRTPFCNLRTSLTYFLDIRSPVSQSLMEVLATMATNEAEEKILTLLSKDVDAYQKWRLCCGLSFVELLQEFSSLQFTAAFLLTQLPVLLHRFYSISSSQLHVPNQIHITIAVLKYTTLSPKNPRKKFGFCSNWLNEVKVGSEIPCFIRKENSFHLPDNAELPVIMVGPGTGIAPFRSFWQQRKEEKSSVSTKPGKMVMYFGCRRLDHDHIYQEELTIMQFQGILDKVHVALSRQPDIPKTYVQNLMEATSSEIYQLLVIDGGHIYICGDAGMASDVTKMLMEIIKKEDKNKNPEAVMEILNNENRIHRDIFGALAPKVSSEEPSSIACVKCS